MKIWIAILILLVLSFSTHKVHLNIKTQQKAAPKEELLYLPVGKYVKIAAIGFDNFIADLVFIRAVQYFGAHFMSDRRYPYLERLFDVIVTLEPTFIEAYRFGALTLGEEAGRFDKAIALLKRGIVNNPKSWELPFDLGFIYFYNLKEVENALDAYKLATTRPGCPDYVQRYIPYLHYEAGRKALALHLWKKIYNEAKDNLIKEIADRNIKVIYLRENLKIIRDALTKYKEKYKKYPDKLTDLVSAGLLKEIPPEPFGGKYEYFPDKGWVFSSVRPQY